MKSDEKPQHLFHAKYLSKAPHTHFQRAGGNPLAVLYIHFQNVAEISYIICRKQQKTQVYVR